MRRLAAALIALALPLTGAASTLAAASERPGSERPDRRGNVVTPGDFTGYGFDQCLAPTQKAMDAWLNKSPFLAVGIYISGDSRACRQQPNLTPTWISTQLAKGWRLLPIALGPQASCLDRFPRYDDDFKISPRPGDAYATARAQGAVEADKNAADAAALGIAAGSTLWYDLEAFDLKDTHCRESALAFVSSWVTRIKERGFVSGFYSSASSGIKMLDDARLQRPGQFALPDRIWIARWDGVANTSTTYIGEDGWRPGGRVKQYLGGHNETWGGVTINIDSNFLDLGAGSQPTPDSHCGGLKVAFWKYPDLTPTAARRNRVKVLQCLLKEKGIYAGDVSGSYDQATVAAANAWQSQSKLRTSSTFSARHWTGLLAAGSTPVLKVGSTGEAVHRLQRALNASGAGRLKSSGLYDARTGAAVRTYQARRSMPATGVVNRSTWKKLLKGVS
ncbi:glycoside hydrolase domain-containing protein [Nocardioides piscis]|uniref:DUF1906 domain-containing protein n=1 Tax=Nocardioides piscis TaxID=2714938 RepID=A0A6G7YEV0_9ACTN|nr:glycoside hydrolase domain-containing protein [Nocardioides piscis]QIK75171.1 DUF1906 domain-containing protein [Nocardioides piscis]